MGTGVRKTDTGRRMRTGSIRQGQSRAMGLGLGEGVCMCVCMNRHITSLSWLSVLSRNFVAFTFPNQSQSRLWLDDFPVGDLFLLLIQGKRGGHCMTCTEVSITFMHSNSLALTTLVKVRIITVIPILT